MLFDLILLFFAVSFYYDILMIYVPCSVSV